MLTFYSLSAFCKTKRGKILFINDDCLWWPLLTTRIDLFSNITEFSLFNLNLCFVLISYFLFQPIKIMSTINNHINNKKSFQWLRSMQGERRLLPAAKGVAVSHSLSTIVVVDLFVSTDCCFLHSVLAGQVGGSTAHVPPPTCEMMILPFNAI